MSKRAATPKPGRKRRREARFDPRPAQAYRNPLTLPFTLGWALLILPIAFAPVLVPSSKDLPAWSALPVLLGYFGVQLWLGMRCALHLHWSVGRDWVRSEFAAPGSSVTQTVENRDFVSLAPWGPIVIATRTSGERHVWPRWLRSQWKTYRWELVDGCLQLAPPPSAAARGRTG